jgi:hypothetical protein
MYPISDPFTTVCLPLSYSGNPGVNGVSNRDVGVSHPFKTVCLPLSYSGNPGVNGESYRGEGCVQ